MFRLIAFLFAFLWSSLLDTDPGGGDNPPPEKVELTTDELTNRTNAAAEARATEIANLLGVDLGKPADVKALIEAGRKAQQPDEDKPAGDKPGEGESIKDQVSAVLNDLLKPITERLDGVEGKTQAREQAEAEQTRNEKLTEALKDANVREDRIDAARTLALANGAKLDDKGELTGSKEAIEATKKALPEAFRGDGDTGRAADANGRERTDRKPKTLAEALTAHYSKS